MSQFSRFAKLNINTLILDNPYNPENTLSQMLEHTKAKRTEWYHVWYAVDLYDSDDAGYDSDDAGYDSDVAGYDSDDAGYDSDDAGYDSDDAGYDDEDVEIIKYQLSVGRMPGDPLPDDERMMYFGGVSDDEMIYTSSDEVGEYTAEALADDLKWLASDEGGSNALFS